MVKYMEANGNATTFAGAFSNNKIGSVFKRQFHLQ